MRLSVRALGAAFALIWGLAILAVGLANVMWPPYGQAFLQALASIYPGYSGAQDSAQVVVATLYGVLDAAIVGGVLAWLYNLFVDRWG